MSATEYDAPRALRSTNSGLPVSAGLTFRAIVLGAVLCVLLTIWTIHSYGFTVIQAT